MFRIGEFSKLAHLSVKTLRFYDEIDLFKPSFVDENGYRYYSIENLNTLKFIVELRNCNVPIDDIKKIINGSDVLTVLQEHEKELKEEIKRNEASLVQLKNLIMKAAKGEPMSEYVANLIDLPEGIVYYREGVIKDFSEIVPFVLEAGEEVRVNNPDLKCSKNEYCYVRYLDNEYKSENLSIEYAEQVTSLGKASKNIKFKEINKGKAVSVIHTGNYDTIRNAYAYAMNWVKMNGYEMCDSIRERYIHGCWDRENPSDYITEIQIPVK